jgi:outer membrane protein OmpA-like peptidoglycan-associated protein
VTVTGYDADTATPEEQDALSLARARSVATALLVQLAARGDPHVAVHEVGDGSSDPVASSTTASGRAKDRRVVASLR